jgi:glycine/D-amino acid oxidase-like deaminating enzyme
VTGQTVEVIVLGAGIVGVSAAYAARQRGLSVILSIGASRAAKPPMATPVFSAAARYRRSTIRRSGTRCRNT